MNSLDNGGNVVTYFSCLECCFVLTERDRPVIHLSSQSRYWASKSFEFLHVPSCHFLLFSLLVSILQIPGQTIHEYVDGNVLGTELCTLQCFLSVMDMTFTMNER